MRRVVITGMGVISPVGNDTETFWQNIKAGKSGIDYVTHFDASEYPTKVAGEVKDFDPSQYIDRKEARHMDRYTQFIVTAAKMALNESGIDLEKTDLDRVGVITGSGIGGIETLEKQHSVLLERGPGKVSPFFVPMMISNIGAAQIAIMTGAKGINENVVSACASGTNAIGDAMRVIRSGMCDVMITGGAEAAVKPLAFAGFCNMKAMSTKEDISKASCPFDAERDGFVMGEGAGIVILEEAEHAKARGANIIAEVVGYGATDDAYHITSPVPGGDGGAKAMKMAIEDAGITPDKIDYINAHGTSTQYNDKFETQAIKTAFGDCANKVAISSTKSMTGHLLGAAGAIETVICAKAIAEGFVPPTINYSTPDPDCDLDYTPNKGRSMDVTYALSNSLGFGGHNATIVLKKYEG